MSEQNNVYEKVTNQVIAAIESNGTVPWKKAWNALGSPINGFTGKSYRGGNVFLLLFAQLGANWEKPVFFGFDQVKEYDKQNRFCHVRKGEAGTVIVFPKIAKDRDTGEEFCVGFGLTRVWNIAQCEGFTENDFMEIQHEFTPIEDAEKIFSLEGLTEWTGSEACYIPSRDTVVMPNANTFINTAEYYHTRAHEYIHATGAKQRLNRDGVSGAIYRGGDTYSYEELVAEMGASFIASRLGLEYNQEMSAGYVAHWLGVLKENTSWIVKASREAAKAVDYLFKEEKEIVNV